MQGAMALAATTGKTAGSFKSQPRMVAVVNASILIQRVFRLRRFVLDKLGPLIFASSDGGKAKWGRLAFDGDDMHTKPRQFMCLSKHTNPTHLAGFVKQYWRVGWPEIIVSVNGGAQDFHLSPRLKRVCMAGFAQMAAAGKVCFFTAGTDAGVTKFVADILHMFEVETDVIGVLTLECVSGYEQIVAPDSSGEVVPYSAANLTTNQWGAKLNPNHTKYILVDTGWTKKESDKMAPWGGEVALRGALESELSAKVRAPIVQLLVQGGPGSLDMALSALRVGTAIVAIADSGGAATALYRCVELGEEAALVAKEVWNLTKEEQIQKLASKLQEVRGMYEAMNRRPEAISAGDRVVHFFVMNASEAVSTATDRLRTLMLSAIISRLTSGAWRHGETALTGTVKLEDEPEASENAENEDAAQLRAGLNLAVAWDCLSIAEPLFDRADPHVLQHTMQRAIAEGRVSFIERIIQQVGRDPSIASVEVRNLYARDLTNAFVGECRPLATAVTSAGAGTGVLVSFFDWVSPHVGAFMGAAAGEIRWIDIFLWATVTGNWKIADYCWPLCKDPLLATVIGAAACRKVASTISRPVVRGKMLARADELERSAVGIFDTVPSVELAHRLLATRVGGLEWVTLLELLMVLEMKQILAHNHTLSLMQLYWRGGSPLATLGGALPVGYPYWRLLFHALCPVRRPMPNQREASGNTKGGAAAKSQPLMAKSMLNALEMFEHESKRAKENMEATSDAARRSQTTGSRDFFKDVITSLQALRENSGGTVVQSTLLDFYSIPKVAFILRSLSDTTSIVLCVLQLLYSTTPGDLDLMAPAIPSPNALDVLLFVDFLSNLLDGIEQSKIRTRLAIAGQQSLLQRFLSYSRLLYIAAVAMRIVSISAADYATARSCYTAFGVLLSMYTTCITLTLMPILSRISKPFGVLVLAIQKMLVAIDMYLVFSVMVMIGFALGVLGFQIFGVFINPLDSVQGAPNRLSWFMLPAFAYISPALSGLAGEDPDWWGAGALFPLAYLFLTSKVLQSLITAIFSSALQSIFKNAEEEYIFDEHRTLFEYRHVLTRVPPPINLPMTAFRLARYYLCYLTSQGKGGFDIGAASSADDNMSTTDKVSVALFVEQYRKAKETAAQGTVDANVTALRTQMQEVEAKVYELHADLGKLVDRFEGVGSRAGGGDTMRSLLRA